MIRDNVKTYNDAVDNFNQSAIRIFKREEANEKAHSASYKSTGRPAKLFAGIGQ